LARPGKERQGGAEAACTKTAKGDPYNTIDSRVLFTPRRAGMFRIQATSYQEQGKSAYTLTIRGLP
jgi:hypothetical protein